MKKCKDIEKLLPLYPNDLRSPDEEEMVRRHLASCSACTEKLATLEKTKRLVSDLGGVAPPPWLRQKIMAAVREKATKKSVWGKWFDPLHIKIPVQIAATLVVAVFAVYLYRAGEDTMKKAVVPPVPSQERQQESFHPKQSETSGKGFVSQNNQEIHAPSPLPEGKRSAAAEISEVLGKQAGVDMHSDESASRPASKDIVSSGTAMKRERPASALDAVSKTQRAFDVSDHVQKPDISLAVADVEQSAADVESILVRLKARKIVQRTTDGEILFFAEMKNQTMKDLIAQLKLIGRVDVDESLAGRTGEDFSVTIGIFED
jgi:hypothetical protein